MKKNSVQLQYRVRFCKLAIENPKKAAGELKDIATGLENCRTTGDVVAALAMLFAISESTIFRDLTEK